MWFIWSCLLCLLFYSERTLSNPSTISDLKEYAMIDFSFWSKHISFDDAISPYLHTANQRCRWRQPLPVQRTSVSKNCSGRPLGSKCCFQICKPEDEPRICQQVLGLSARCSQFKTTVKVLVELWFEVPQPGLVISKPLYCGLVVIVVMCSCVSALLWEVCCRFLTILYSVVLLSPTMFSHMAWNYSKVGQAQ